MDVVLVSGVINYVEISFEISVADFEQIIAGCERPSLHFYPMNKCVVRREP